MEKKTLQDQLKEAGSKINLGADLEETRVKVLTTLSRTVDAGLGLILGQQPLAGIVDALAERLKNQSKEVESIKSILVGIDNHKILFDSAKNKEDRDKAYKNFVRLVVVVKKCMEKTSAMIKESREITKILGKSYTAIQFGIGNKLNSELTNCFLLYHDAFDGFEEKYITPFLNNNPEIQM